jgi:outer membrane protein
MRGSAIVASLALSGMALGAAPAFAQVAGQARPSQPAPAAGQARPAPPAAPAPPPVHVAPQPPLVFPTGSKFAFINPQRVFQESVDGRAAVTRVNALIAKKQKDNEDRAKLLAGNQQKLQTSGSVMNDAARSQLEKEIEKQQLDAQRFQQDAQAEINELQMEVQNEFIKKVSPVIQAIASEKGLQVVFNAAEAGLAWVDANLDLTLDVIKKLDAVAKPAAAK